MRRIEPLAQQFAGHAEGRPAHASIMGLGFRGLGFSIFLGILWYPIMENQMEKEMNMKWKLGVYRGSIILEFLGIMPSSTCRDSGVVETHCAYSLCGCGHFFHQHHQASEQGQAGTISFAGSQHKELCAAARLYVTTTLT